MTRFLLILLCGCSAPDYENRHDSPRGKATGPAAAAWQAKLEGALHDKENQLEARERRKVYARMMATNSIPIPTNERLDHPRAAGHP